MAKKWKIVARHKHVANAVITELVHVDTDNLFRRFVATICGYQYWNIAQGCMADGDFTFDDVINRVTFVRDLIERNENDPLFKMHEIEETIVWKSLDEFMAIYGEMESQK